MHYDKVYIAHNIMQVLLLNLILHVLWICYISSEYSETKFVVRNEVCEMN